MINPEGRAMTDPAIVGAAVVLVLSSLGGTIVLVINALSASKDRREAAAERKQQLELAIASAKVVKETADKTDALLVGNAKIHELTNNTNSQLQKALELKSQELNGARELMAQMEKTARDIAATRAVTDLQTSEAFRTVPAPVVGASAMQNTTSSVLKSIDTNTAAIDENTKKTGAKADSSKEGTEQ